MKERPNSPYSLCGSHPINCKQFLGLALKQQYSCTEIYAIAYIFLKDNISDEWHKSILEEMLLINYRHSNEIFTK
jgi:hypothetical protein